MRGIGRWGMWAVGLALLAGAEPASASSAPDLGRTFEPPALPAPVYGIKPPASERQVRRVVAADGVELYTETWLPEARDGKAPPERVPVVVIFSIYATPGSPDADQGWAIPLLVPRGYAVTYAHPRGFGGSGGCYRFNDALEVSDGARVIEDAGELAPWSDGNVGMLGFSNPGGTQISTATGPERDRLESLRALVVGAPNASLYDTYHHDGVPHMMQSQLPGVASLQFPLEREGCELDNQTGLLDVSGDYTPFYAERDHTRDLERLTTPILMHHGHADRTVGPHGQIGLFDALPAATPRAGLFGVWDHEYPDDYRSNPSSPRRDWERADFRAMMVAWYERWLRHDRSTGVDRWPVAQVQGTDGQWRTASTWPRIPGPAARLLLGPAGTLGAKAPTGSTTFLEFPAYEMEIDGTSQPPPGTTAVFTTPPLPRRMEIAGAPGLDLWVRLAAPDAHLTAQLEVLDAAGRRLTRESRTMGARSAMHLDPLESGRFRQAHALPAPIARPVRVTLRMNPTDLAIPAGARLRLTVTGSSIAWDGLEYAQREYGAIFQGPTLPSGLAQPVTILHDCEHRSALRFTLPETDSELLNVRERDEPAGPLKPGLALPHPATDGGGLATAPVCS